MSYIRAQMNLVTLNDDVRDSYDVGLDAETYSAEDFRRIAIYRSKNVWTGADGKITPPDLGIGLVDLKAVTAPIHDGDWEGWLTVEHDGSYPHPASQPEELVRQGREYLRRIADL